jgi:hypothetical protein
LIFFDFRLFLNWLFQYLLEIVIHVYQMRLQYVPEPVCAVSIPVFHDVVDIDDIILVSLFNCVNLRVLTAHLHH